MTNKKNIEEDKNIVIENHRLKERVKELEKEIRDLKYKIKIYEGGI